MRYILYILLLLSSGNALQAVDRQEYQVTQTETSTDAVDELLDDARQNPTQEVPEIKPVSTVEFWLRKIGTAFVIQCIYIKQYIANQICALSNLSTTEQHEKQSDN